MRELFHEIAGNLRNNKLRTVLTGFAVSWGIFLLICLLGAGNGLMNSFMGNMSDYNTQTIYVEGWRTSKPYAGYQEGRLIQLDESDFAWTEGPRWNATVGNVTRQTASTGVTFSCSLYSGITPEIWPATVFPSREKVTPVELVWRVTLPTVGAQRGPSV